MTKRELHNRLQGQWWTCLRVDEVVDCVAALRGLSAYPVILEARERILAQAHGGIGVFGTVVYAAMKAEAYK